jgi:hypothetical protein
MTEVWLLAALIVVLVMGVAGLVLAWSRPVPEEMSESWRRENERDSGKS